MPSIATTRLFQPLTGLELAKIIQDDISARIAEDGNFREHLTYPEVEYTFTLKIVGYPISYDINVEGGRVFTTGETLTTEPQSATIETSRALGSTQETAPDRLREDAGLPTTRPTPTADGRIVDQEQPPRQPARSVTVGKAATGKPRPVNSIDLAKETSIDEEGKPIKFNRIQ